MRSHGSFGYNILKHTLDGATIANASESTIQLAYKFRLPCRLRFSGMARFSVPGSTSGYVVILNEIQLPGPAPMNEALERVGGDESKLRSTAVAVFQKPKPSADFFRSLAQGTITAEDGVTQQFESLSLDTLNRIIIAHRNVADIDFGSSSYPLIDGESLELKVWVYTPTDHTLSDEDVKSIASLVPVLGWGRISVCAPNIDVGDLTPENADRIRRVFTRIDQQVFDEFEYASYYFQFQGEEFVSLLMAVVALEAAHSAFLREYLNRCGIDNSATGNYLREQGFTATLPITAKLFMRQENRPTSEELDSCLKGITIRNDIMHGKPQMRKRMDKIHDARRSVLAVEKRLVDELEHILTLPMANAPQ